tara:strand:+ start:5793 stop:6107 length:315 start_codon:yes stop_codon:yes gene_type:complete
MNQKEVIKKLLRVNRVTQEDVSKLLGVKQSSLSRTLENDCLKYYQLCRIYKKCTGSEFECGLPLIDNAGGFYFQLTVKQVIDILKSYGNFNLLIRFGSEVIKIK